MSEVGRPTELSDELCLEIRNLVLEGKNLKEIAELCGIAYKTMEAWCSRNYQGFADNMRTYRMEWRLKKAEENIDEVLGMETEQPLVDKAAGPIRDVEGAVIKYKDPKLLKVKADISQFVAETIGKNDYSKRSELTGAKGKELLPQATVAGMIENLSKKCDKRPEKYGGDVSSPGEPKVASTDGMVPLPQAGTNPQN